MMIPEAMMAKLWNSVRKLVDFGKEKSKQVLTAVNLLLELLPRAGFEITQLDIALSIIPTVTIGLHAGPAVSEEALKAVLQESKENKIVAAVLSYLVQAHRLCTAVNVGSIELKELKILLNKLPSVSLAWKEKAKLALPAVAA